MPKESPEMQHLPKMKSWQVFAFARKRLTASALYRIFGKTNARAIDYWCEDPAFTARPEGSYDPIQGLKRLFTLLDDYSHQPVIRACIAYLVSDTSLAEEITPRVVDLKPTMAEEILADFSAVSELQKAIEDKHNLTSVQKKLTAAIAELERTYALYQEQNG